MSIIRSQVVTDLGFGDSGKGMVVDSLCEEAPSPLVVRHCGGPQAGHTVHRGEMRHTFSSFGSGTLQGVPSFFGPKTLIYLPNLLREYRKLEELIGPDNIRLYIDPRAQLIMPSDVALCRTREKLKDHGSCGIGIGTTMMRVENSPISIPAGCLFSNVLLESKLQLAGQWAEAEMREMVAGDDDWVPDYFKEQLKTHVHDWSNAFHSLRNFRNVQVLGLSEVIREEATHMLIFEGAQGVCLDRHFGQFPHVTYADTSSRNAFEIIRELGLVTPVDVTHIHRCYTTRHGNGWMPSEWDQEEIDLYLDGLDSEHNTDNEWQGAFRRGDIEWELVYAAMQYDRGYHAANTLSSLVITCMDQRQTDFSLPLDMLQTWGFDDIKFSDSPQPGLKNP